MRGFSFLNITGRGVGTVNEPAVRMEEQIMADIPGREELPEQYGRLGFCRAYLYRCYQKKQEEKSFGKEE